MTTSGIAGAYQPHVSVQKSSAQAPEPAAHSKDFSQTLQDRAALTDPATQLTDQLGGDAPSAVSFDRADLFGRAVDLAHLADARSPDHLPHGTVNNSNVSTRVDPFSQDPALAVSGLSATGEEAVAAGRSDVNASHSLQVSARSAQALPATGLDQPEAVIDGMGSEPKVQVTPALSVGELKLSSPGAVRMHSANGAGAEAAEQRQAVVEAFTPLNVVVRATQAGVQVTARVTGLRIGEDADLKNAIADTVQSNGDVLHDLRLNGRGISRSRECQ